jgi:hypothetical protein
MGRFAGRNGRIYMGINSGDAASPLPFIAKWSVKFATDRFDVTAMGDGNKVYVAGLPDASGDFSGWMDNATKQTYTAAVDGLARNQYIYPDVTNTPGLYMFGTSLVDFNIDGDVGGAVALSASWSAASTWARVG